jgi:hypothetical protein
MLLASPEYFERLRGKDDFDGKARLQMRGLLKKKKICASLTQVGQVEGSAGTSPQTSSEEEMSHRTTYRRNRQST